MVAGAGRAQQCALDDCWRAFLLKRRYQCFTQSQFRQYLFGIKIRIIPEGLGDRLDGLAIGCRERPESVLDTVAKLAGYAGRNVERVLGDEIDPDTL